ncbi:MAG: hypothetical protein RIT43_1664 [Bacteroidota bacterium]|jgi:hypothetical protein
MRSFPSRLLVIIIGFFVLQPLFYSSCTKDEIKAIEDAISFEFDALETNVSNAESFSFTVKLLSAMPADGVKLEINAKEELSGTLLNQNASIVSKGVQTMLSVKNLPRQKWVIVTVNVCSTKTPSNCVSKTFKVVFK